MVTTWQRKKTTRGEFSLILLSPRIKTFTCTCNRAVTCGIQQIKEEHLKEYVSPSKASNNCLIQFSPATCKQGQVLVLYVQQNCVFQSRATWVPSPHKKNYVLKMCHNAACSFYFDFRPNCTTLSSKDIWSDDVTKNEFLKLWDLLNRYSESTRWRMPTCQKSISYRSV